MNDRAARLCRRLSCFAAAVFLTLSLPAQAEWSSLDALSRSGARVSASAVDLDNGSVLQQLNGDTRLSPASLTKLVVAAAALDTWPADKMFETRLLGVGPFRNGRIDGDLIVQSLGDSTLDHQTLWALAAQLKGSGVTSVSGRLIVNTSPFGVLGCETQDRCDAMKRSATAFNAPIAAIGVDYGNWCIDVRPTAAGSEAVVAGCGVAELPIPVEGEIKTVGEKAKQTFWVERVTEANGDVIRVGGNVPIGSGQSVYRAMSDPALGAGLLVRQTLRESGVKLDGAVVISHDAVPANAYPLARIEGLSLKEQLGRMLRFSNNYIADVLTLNIAAAARRGAPKDLASAGGALSDFVDRAQKSGKGPKGSPTLRSGSGLTPENEISASELTGLLENQYRDTRNFPAFYGGLVVPRQAPFAFLRGGSAGWLDRVALKTGTMNDPYSVCGISGYIRKKGGGWIAFAVIVNGGPKLKHVPLYKAMEAARKDIDVILSKY